MKNLILSLTLLFSLSAYSQLEWEPIPGIPQYGINGGIHFEANGKIYYGLGRLQNNTYSNALWEYDPSNQQWTKKANFPGGGRFYATGFSINNKGYVGMGRDGSSNYNDLYEYNPLTDSWTAKANFPGVARFNSAFATIGDTAFVGMGSTSSSTSSYQSDFYMYIPASNTWVTRTSFPGGGGGSFATFTIGDKAYFGGMILASGSSNNFWAYTRATNTWASITAMPGPIKRGASSFTFNGEGYVGLGAYYSTSSTTFTNNFHKYTPSTNTWSSIASSPNMIGRYKCGVWNIGDSTIIIGGGWNNYNLSDFWELKLTSDTCTFLDTINIQVNDTTIIEVFDTTTVQVNDTSYTIINDTTFISDTSYVQIFDTTTVYKLDTLQVYIIDTIYRTISDTINVFRLDTIFTTIYDTTFITAYDTTSITQYISVQDTLKIRVDTDCGTMNFKLYPNPSQEFVYLYSSNIDCLEGSNLLLLNSIGQVLETKAFDGFATFDIRGLANELYLLRLISNNGNLLFTKKILKE